MNLKGIKLRYSINSKFFNFVEDEECIEELYIKGYTLYEKHENNRLITYCEEFDKELNINNSYANCIKL